MGGLVLINSSLDCGPICCCCCKGGDIDQGLVRLANVPLAPPLLQTEEEELHVVSLLGPTVFGGLFPHNEVGGAFLCCCGNHEGEVISKADDRLSEE